MDAFVFAGQGSQRVGMGADLFDLVPEFRHAEPEIDAVLGYSLRQLCLKDPDKKLQQTAYTQPALYVVNALCCYQALAKGLRPRYLAGHSLGEYNALLAAGVFDFITGLRLVQKRGALMSQAQGGGMAAVVGMPPRRIMEQLREHGLGDLDVANFNSRTQTVISGPLADIQRAGPLFEKAGPLAYFPLPVSAAFHSRYMKGAAKEFEQFLTGFAFRAPKIAVLANVTARPYKVVEDSGSVRDLLVQQICSPVQWTNSVLYLLDRGVTMFHEMGPGNVLTRLVQQIRKPPEVRAAVPAPLLAAARSEVA